MSKKSNPVVAAMSLAEYIESGLDSKKCRRCGKLAGVIDSAAWALEGASDPAVQALAPRMNAFRQQVLKQASSDFGCGGCWGAKARKALSKAAGRQGRSATTAAGPKLIDAKEQDLRRDGVARFAVEWDGAGLCCLRMNRRGVVTHRISGPAAESILAAAEAEGLLKRGGDAARLGLDLARAEAAQAVRRASTDRND